jgi:predicted Zn-ribbon and HTH transcriptional regulator
MTGKHEPTTPPTECPDCGVEMRESNDGVTRCPYCNSWAFRDDVSDGAIYAAASKGSGT